MHMPFPHARRRHHALAAAAAALALASPLVALPAHAAAGCADARTPGCSTAQHPAPRDALAGVRTAGRVEEASGAALYTWPGVYFEGRFRGTGVGIVLDDAVNDYDVQVDGATVAVLVQPGTTTYWVKGLAAGVHGVRLAKRTESPWAAGEFGGFTAAPGGRLLGAPAARSRQIEFIGDSLTVGYGNLSTTRDCTANGGVDRNTDADLGFAAQAGRGLGADYQITAYSGRGMVRNYDGGEPGTDFRTYYDRGLQSVPGDVWQQPRSWRPQLVVVNLGTNDFSTPLHAGEQWATQDDLVSAYRTAYLGFLDKLRARYGPRTTIVVSAHAFSGNPAFPQAAHQVVREANRRGDSKVRYWYYDSPDLDRLGCDWHYSLHDDGIVAGLLTGYVDGLHLRW